MPLPPVRKNPADLNSQHPPNPSLLCPRRLKGAQEADGAVPAARPVRPELAAKSPTIKEVIAKFPTTKETADADLEQERTTFGSGTTSATTCASGYESPRPGESPSSGRHDGEPLSVTASLSLASSCESKSPKSPRRPSLHSSETLSNLTDSARKVSSFINHKVEERQHANAEHHDPRLHHISHQVVWVTMAFFTVAAIVLMFFCLFHAHPENFTTTFFVTSIAAASYFAKAVGMGDLVAFGVRVPFVRYVDWICTTPMMLYELCHIGNASSSVTMMVVGCDLLMLAFGIVSACLDRKEKLAVKYTWFFLSCGFYILMLCSLHKDIANGSALDQPDDVMTLFSRLEWLTICTWSLYPVIVILGRAHAGLISKPSEDMCLCVLDTIAKIGMEGLIVASCSAPDAMCHGSGGEAH